MDFDDIIERRGTHALKWDGATRYSGVTGDDVIPMWVADTDFRVAPVIRDALRAMNEHGVFGYMSDIDAMREAVVWWMKTRHAWEIAPDEILPTHGLGNAIALLIDCLTEPGDGVLIFTPVYHEFAGKIRRIGRQPVEVRLASDSGRQTFDLDAAAAACDCQTQMLILCSPQNPGGRVWTAGELKALGDFADRHDLWVVADEIHQDLVYPGTSFRPMASVTDIHDRLITIAAPSKTFNTAGLRLGYMLVKEPTLRDRLGRHLAALSIQPNMAGVAACAAGYGPDGADWADRQMAYLDCNRQLLDRALNAIPGVRSMPLESTFLAWVDFSGTGMDQAEIEDRVLRRAKVIPNLGPTFGPGGELHLRFNFGTRRALVEEAAVRIAEAFADLQ